MSASQAVRIAVEELYREIPQAPPMASPRDPRLSGHDLAFLEGQDAKRAGLTCDDCPYLSCIDPACRSLWLSGFHNA